MSDKNKKRTSFTLDADVIEALDDFALFTGQSKSQFVNSCLRESLGYLEKLTEVLKYAKANPNVDMATIESQINEQMQKLKSDMDSKAGKE